MNSDRIKEIQQTTAYPESLSVHQALLQVWNECEQSHPTSTPADKSFGKFLVENMDKGNDYRLVVTVVNDNNVVFYCHPLNRDGDTFDGFVENNLIHPRI